MKYVFLLLFLMLYTPAFADGLESRAHDLGQTIRCMVCEGQSIEESNAALAKDMRQYVRQQMREGKTDRDITEDLRARYGDGVSLLPPVKPVTWPLWLLPPLMMLCGLAWIFLQAKGKRK